MQLLGDSLQVWGLRPFQLRTCLVVWMCQAKAKYTIQLEQQRLYRMAVFLAMPFRYVDMLESTGWLLHSKCFMSDGSLSTAMLQQG